MSIRKFGSEVLDFLVGFGFCVGVFVAVVALIAAPALVVLWAANTVYPGLHAPYNSFSVVAVYVLYLAARMACAD